jgi:hypothetical protein
MARHASRTQDMIGERSSSILRMLEVIIRDRSRRTKYRHAERNTSRKPAEPVINLSRRPTGPLARAGLKTSAPALVPGRVEIAGRVIRAQAACRRVIPFHAGENRFRSRQDRACIRRLPPAILSRRRLFFTAVYGPGRLKGRHATADTSSLIRGHSVLTCRFRRTNPKSPRTLLPPRRRGTMVDLGATTVSSQRHETAWNPDGSLNPRVWRPNASSSSDMRYRPTTGA